MLSILTFNAGLWGTKFWFNRKISYEPIPYVEERLKLIPQELIATSADIIALQEVYRNDHKNFLVDHMSSVYPFHASCRRKFRFGVESGLMFFSKFPILQEKFEVFKRAPFLERQLDPKGLLTVNIDTDDLGPLVFLNHHTTVGGVIFSYTSSITNKVRKKQIQQITEKAKQTEAVSVILGDLNAGPGVAEKNYLTMLQNYHDPFAASLEKTSINTFVSWDPKNLLNANGPYKSCSPQKVDHVFLPRHLSDRVTEAKIVLDQPVVYLPNGKLVTISDHYGVMVNID